VVRPYPLIVYLLGHLLGLIARKAEMASHPERCINAGSIILVDRCAQET